MGKTTPFFTILVAIRNVGTDLRESLDSFERQSWRDFEVVIADCNSTDNPEQYIKDRPFPIRHVVQGDKGIYDAWNKVLPLARGEWINFMGAGDHFVTDHTLEEVAGALKAMPEDVLMAYGLVDVVGENDEVVLSAGLPWEAQLREIAEFGMYPHQATFQRRDTFERFGYFDDSFRIASDVEMLLRLAKHKTPEYFSVKVANFQFGGASNVPKNKLRALEERNAILHLHGVNPRSYGFFKVKAVAVDFLYRTLPEDKLRRVIDLYRVVTGRKPRFGIVSR